VPDALAKVDAKVFGLVPQVDATAAQLGQLLRALRDLAQGARKGKRKLFLYTST
jgi:hypothetical protein